MRCEKTGSIRSDAPSSCTSQLAWPNQVRRAGSPGAGGRASAAGSGGVKGTFAVRALFRLRPASLSNTAQRNTAEAGCGPDPSRFLKRMRRLYQRAKR